MEFAFPILGVQGKLNMAHDAQQAANLEVSCTTCSNKDCKDSNNEF